MVKSKIFAQGDWIVHAYYGLGQVAGIEHRHSDGKEKVYYRVEAHDTISWVDVKKAKSKRVRRIATKTKMRKAIRLLQEKPDKLFGNFNSRQKYIK